MTKLTVGERYTAGKFRSGESRNGAWELLTVADEKGKNEISIFPSNIPVKGRDGCDFVVKSIGEVKFGFKKGTDGVWHPQCSVSAEVEVIESDIDLSFVDDGPLPWEEGDMMDDIGLPL